MAERCAKYEYSPQPWSRITTLPEKYRSPVSATVAAFGALMATPSPERKSVPLWGLRASPLKTLRRPKLLVERPGTGRAKPPRHNRSGLAARKMADVSSCSRRMRSITSGGGSTYLGATLRRRVGNSFGATSRA